MEKFKKIFKYFVGLIGAALFILGIADTSFTIPAYLLGIWMMIAVTEMK